MPCGGGELWTIAWHVHRGVTWVFSTRTSPTDVTLMKGASMRVFNLLFGNDVKSLTLRPGLVGTATPTPDDAEKAGWCGGDAPAIGPRSWPRSQYTGLPMIHVITLKLPVEYRCQGDDLVAISLFSAEDGEADVRDEVEAVFEGDDVEGESPLVDEVRDFIAHRHPQQRDLEDILDGNLALLWLTESEFSGPKTSPPVDHGHERDDVSRNAWDHTAEECGVWLSERHDDPNAGIPPEDFPNDDPPYTDVLDLGDDFMARIETGSHIGGTIVDTEGLPNGMSQYFLRLEHDIGGMYFKSYLDLKTGLFAAQD